MPTQDGAVLLETGKDFSSFDVDSPIANIAWISAAKVSSNVC
jgi:hypothetical protein